MKVFGKRKRASSQDSGNKRSLFGGFSLHKGKPEDRPEENASSAIPAGPSGAASIYREMPADNIYASPAQATQDPQDSQDPGAASHLLAEHERILQENRLLHQSLEQLKNEIIGIRSSQQEALESSGGSLGSNNEEVFNLLAELKGDIIALKNEQETLAVIPSGPAGGEVGSLLAELKRDIDDLKKEQAALLQPSPAIPEAGEDVQALLAELKKDISSLKQEQAALKMEAPQKTAASEVHDLLAELKRDITDLKREQAAMASQPEPKDGEAEKAGGQELSAMLARLGDEPDGKPQPEAGADKPASQDQGADSLDEQQVSQDEQIEEVHDLLAELKCDIEVLKQEQKKARAEAGNPHENEVREMLAELRSDILALKEEQAEKQYSAPAPGTSSSSRIAGLLAELKGEIDTARQQAAASPAPHASAAAEGVLADIQTLDAVNNVLSLLIGSGAGETGEEEAGHGPENEDSLQEQEEAESHDIGQSGAA